MTDYDDRDVDRLAAEIQRQHDLADRWFFTVLLVAASVGLLAWALGGG